MQNQQQNGPLDTLGEAYNNMYEHVASNLHKATDKAGPLLHDLIDEAKEKGDDLDKYAEEDIEKISVWLKRDLDDVVSYLSETDYSVRDWLGFEVSLIKNAMIHSMLDTADKTTVELLRMKESSEKSFVYKTGEVVGVGTLICDNCGEKMRFLSAGEIPACTKCKQTKFHRV